MSSVHHRVTHSVPLGVNENSQVKLCLIKIPLCRTRPATHVLFCKRPERMKAACGAEMIKQISRTSFSSASKIVLGLLVILGKINTGTPAILGLLERLRGWLCISLRATRFLFQRTFCCFLKKEVQGTGITSSGHSRRCMNSGLTAWKKASIPQLLIHHKDHTLLCALTVGENADTFQRVPALQAFPCSGRSPAGKP